MPYKNPEDKRTNALAWARARYHTDPEFRAHLHASSQERRARNKAWVLTYKASHPCVNCGESDPHCLCFHHRPGTAKLAELGQLASSTMSICRIEAEAAKCDILCANCHMKLHY